MTRICLPVPARTTPGPGGTLLVETRPMCWGTDYPAPDLPELDITDPESDLAFLAKKCVVCSAMVWGINRLNLQLFPKGILQQEKDYSNKKQADPVQRQGLALIFQRDLDKNLEELEKQISILQTPEIRQEEREFQLPEIGFNKEDSFVDL